MDAAQVCAGAGREGLRKLRITNCLSISNWSLVISQKSSGIYKEEEGAIPLNFLNRDTPNRLDVIWQMSIVIDDYGVSACKQVGDFISVGNVLINCQVCIKHCFNRLVIIEQYSVRNFSVVEFPQDNYPIRISVAPLKWFYSFKSVADWQSNEQK